MDNTSKESTGYVNFPQKPMKSRLVTDAHNSSPAAGNGHIDGEESAYATVRAHTPMIYATDAHNSSPVAKNDEYFSIYMGHPQLSLEPEVKACRQRLLTHRDMLNRVLEPRYGLLDSLLSSKVLTFDEMDQVRSESTLLAKNTKLVDTLVGKTTMSDFEQLMSALKDTRQEHIVNYLEHDGDLDLKTHERPLTDEELHQFNDRRVELIDLLDTSELLDHLTAADCLSEWQRNDIKSRRTAQEQNMTFLDIFMRRSHSDVEKLVYWLCETKQKHVADLLGDYDLQRLRKEYGSPKRTKSKKKACSVM